MYYIIYYQGISLVAHCCVVVDLLYISDPDLCTGVIEKLTLRIVFNFIDFCVLLHTCGTKKHFQFLVM